MRNFDNPISEARAIEEGAANTIIALRVLKWVNGYCVLLRLAGGKEEMYMANDSVSEEPLWFKTFERLAAYLETRFPPSIAKNFSVTLFAEESTDSPDLGPRLRPERGHAWHDDAMPRTSTPIIQRLRERFGELGSRELLGKMDLVGVKPNQLAVAVAGYGARYVRCAIAHALGEMPSTLWPYLSPVTRKRDDASMQGLGGQRPASIPDAAVSTRR